MKQRNWRHGRRSLLWIPRRTLYILTYGGYSTVWSWSSEESRISETYYGINGNSWSHRHAHTRPRVQTLILYREEDGHDQGRSLVVLANTILFSLSLHTNNPTAPLDHPTECMNSNAWRPMDRYGTRLDRHQKINHGTGRKSKTSRLMGWAVFPSLRSYVIKSGDEHSSRELSANE